MRSLPDLCPAYDLPLDADPIDLMPSLDHGRPPTGGGDGDGLGLRSLLEHPEVLASSAAWWRDERAHRS